MNRLALASMITAIGCAPVQYTPPARTIAFDSPISPPVGHVDVQGDVAGAGAVLGPSFGMGDGRLRVAVTDRVVLEGELGVLTEADANQGANPSATAFTGRAGVMLRTRPDDIPQLQAALIAGVGGGLSSTAGDWESADLGGALATRGRYVRAFIGADVTYSTPDHPQSFTVYDGSDAQSLQLQPTLTVRGTLGVEFGPRESTLIVGMSFIAPMYVDGGAPPSGVDGNTGFIQLGVGLRIQP